MHMYNENETVIPDDELELDGNSDENKPLSPNGQPCTHGTHAGSLDNWRTRHNAKPREFSRVA